MGNPNTCVHVKYELKTRNSLREEKPEGPTPGYKEGGGKWESGLLCRVRGIGIWTFRTQMKEAVGQGFLVLNLEGTGGIGILGSPQCGRDSSQAGQLFFFSTTHSAELQFPCICPAEWSLRHVLFRSSFRAYAWNCGASSRATATTPTSPLTSLLSPRDGCDARTTPPGAPLPMCPVDFWETESAAFPPAFTAPCSVLEVPASSAAF